MELAPFNEFFSGIASTETHSLTLLTTIPGDPPAGKYYFIEMFCMDPECDCRNAVITVCKEMEHEQFQEVTKLRFCWEDSDFYASIGLDFYHDGLPNVFRDLNARATPFEDFFIKQFGEACYLNFNERPSLRRESEYAKRIKRHYRLFKQHMVKVAKQRGQAVFRRL